MQVDINTEIKVTLVLDKEEAQWLKNVMQNPLHGDTPETEHPQDRYTREVFWSTLREKLGLFPIPPGDE